MRLQLQFVPSMVLLLLSDFLLLFWFVSIDSILQTLVSFRGHRDYLR